MDKMRGIVASSFKHISKNELLVRGSIDELSLRHYLLYWDKIDYPNPDEPEPNM